MRDGKLGAYPCAGSVWVDSADTENRAQQACHRMKRNVARMRFAIRGIHIDTAAGSDFRCPVDDAALADTRRSDQDGNTAGAADRVVETLVRVLISQVRSIKGDL